MKVFPICPQFQYLTFSWISVKDSENDGKREAMNAWICAHFLVPLLLSPANLSGLELVNWICYVQCEAPKISKLVYNSNNYGLWYL
jgi:hypothetical protein